MYANYFGLNENPFAITPDPRYLFLSERHTEALAHLLYGITESGGFIQLTGEVGTGKTTLIRSLLEKLPANVDVALIINPRISVMEFLQGICRELHLEVDAHAGSQQLIDALNTRLLEAHAAGRRVVLIVDEAQMLSAEVLEQLRLLTNLETRTRKLLQIILVGQPELRTLLARQDLRQLAQRITGRYHLEPLSRVESGAYVHHRLGVAGAVAPLFRTSALRAVQTVTGGIPRLINIICDRALLGAYTRELRQVDAALVRRAAREVLGERRSRPLRQWGAALAVLALSLVTLLAVSGRLPGFAPGVTVKDAAPVTRQTGVSVGDWLTNPAHATDTDTAFTTLFALWSAAYAAGKDGNACEQARAAGLRCLYRRGTWNNLRSFNRPAIITLTDTHGVLHQVVIVALDAHDAVLQAGSARARFPLATLEPLWYGEYLLLWRPNPAASAALQPGMTGTAVGWLRTQLAALQHTPDTGSNDYDASLEEAVKKFQAAQHLTVDGIAGEETLLHLNSVLHPAGTPYLATGS
ncbi:MAG TPA: AAA family ATPase [Gammaproteobacteria bacterium]|nr:AAA family ATPase [Gammaproteobacteria bacterium]